MKYVATGSRPTDFTSTEQWKTLQYYFSTGLTRHELLSIAEILRETLHLPKISREATRNTPNLFKWFCANWSEIKNVLPYVTLFDDNFNEISLRVQCSHL